MNHIDALLSSGPGWNWLAPTRTTIVYTFAVIPGNTADAGRLSSSVSTFNANQQAAVVSVLNDISLLTGITFAVSANGNAADMHFGAANITSAGVTGLCSWDISYSLSGDNVFNYRADAWIYLDNAEFVGTTQAPAAGNAGYQVLLHEIGHALGLKHPFEGSVTLPGAQDNTAFTLMSYTDSGGPYSSYNAYDIAALMWLYGGDGLGGQLGHSTGGRYLIGSALADALIGGGGDDTFEGGPGDDTISGGSGSDTARFTGNRAQYAVTAIPGGFQLVGPDGTDTLQGVENARFGDQILSLQGAGNSAPTGALAVTGTAKQGQALTISSTLADVDGLGSLSYRWQASANASTWGDISGATAAGFTPGEAQVGLLVRVVGSYVDGQGHSESVNSSATLAVANVNDAPTGVVFISGNPQQGVVLTAASNLVDADGPGVVSYRWQASPDGNRWSDVAAATHGIFTPAEGQVGLRLRAIASYTDGHGTAEIVFSSATAAVVNTNDAPIGMVTVGGTPVQGSSVSANTSTLADSDGLGALAYRWQASPDGNGWSDLVGATAATFTPAEAQVGQFLRVLVNYTDARGTVETVSGVASARVANVNGAPGGTVLVQGQAEQGQVLQSSNSLSDADGLGAIGYEWQMSSSGAAWSAIASASGASVTLGAAQVGQLIRAVAHYTDGHGTAESPASTASAQVRGVQQGGPGNDVLDGTVYSDRLEGQAGNDRLAGHAGDDQIHGGAGIDTAVFELARAHYELAAKGSSVRALSGGEGTDTLLQVERLQFTDLKLAFDLDGHAGTTARFLGAVFGREAVANRSYSGIGLNLLAGGISAEALMQLALDARLGANWTPSAEVQLLYLNLVGAPPSSDELSYWTGQMAAGQYTPVSLAIYAASLELNAVNIDLVGLAEQGLPFV